MKIKLLRALAGMIALACLWSVPAAAEWRRAESPNFIVYSSGSEARLRARILQLEDYHRLLNTVTNIREAAAPNKLAVYIVSGNDDLRLVRNVPTGVAGFYTASPYGIAAFVDGQTEAGGNEVLFHEYTHHYMWQYAPSSYPAWYVEGFADYFSTANFREQDIEIGRPSEGRAYAVAGRAWLPMERVLFDTYRGLSRERTGQYYAQSWLTVHFFYSNLERNAALRRYLAAIRQGTDPREALQSAAGFTPETLERGLRDYIRGGRMMFRRMERPVAEAPPVNITVLPRSADDLILLEANLRVGSSDVYQAALLERVRTAAARHAQDAYALRVLAHAEVMYGDRAAGERLLDGLLASAPNDAELLYLKGMRYLLEAEHGEEWEANARNAARWFARAHRADQYHFQTLYRYVQSLRGRASFDTENTANILALAHQLAPQVVEISMNTARMLIARRDFDFAETILRPLASNPHEEGLAQAAQQLLEQVREARGTQPATTGSLPIELPPEAAGE